MKPVRVGLSPKERFAILQRDGFACQYCGARAPNARLFVDHILPVAHGGTNEEANLITACFECNAGKAADRVPLFELRWRVWTLVGKLPRKHPQFGQEWFFDRAREMVDAFIAESMEHFVLEAAQLPLDTFEDWRQYCHDYLTESYVHLASESYVDGYTRFCRKDIREEHNRKFSESN